MRHKFSRTTCSRLEILGTAFLVVGLILMATASAAAANHPAAAPRQPRAGTALTAGPLLIENAGQYPQEARFLLKRGDQSIWLTNDAVWLVAPELPAPIRFTFPGASASAPLEPFGRAPTHVSYLLGGDPAGWHADVPVWTGARYRDLLPGVDLVIGDGMMGAVPWRLEARAGAGLSGLALRVDGADKVTAESGALRLEAASHTLRVDLPGWLSDGMSSAVKSTSSAQGDGATFAIAAAQSGEPVTPSAADAVAVGDLIFSANLGGTGADAGYGIAVDYNGNSYVTGATVGGTGFPITGTPFDPTHNGAGTNDAFVAKYSPTGTLLYATFLGGGGNDTGNGIAVDQGLAYVVGETDSNDFPGISGSVVGTDLFVAAFNGTGTALRYSTRVGGSDFDTASGIAIDALGAYVTGMTYSTDLGGINCSTNADVMPDLLVTKLDAQGVKVYTSCYGGNSLDAGYAIAVRGGVAYVSGETWSTDLPGLTLNGPSDILLAKFATNGSLAASTLVGGSDADSGTGIALDGSENVYVSGLTSSTDFPVSGGTPAYGGGASDGVVVKRLPTLAASFALYVGGGGDDSADRIAVDTVEALYLGGATTGSFPVTSGAYATSPFGGSDIFVARMLLAASASNKLTYATYLGTANEDWTGGAATDTAGNAFVTGAANAAPPFYASDYALVAGLKVSTPPGAPNVTISRSGANASLTWLAVAAAHNYQVFRSSVPYFVAGDWSSPLPVSSPDTPGYSDNAALNQVDARFYLVKAVSDAPAAGPNSNRVGKFSYQLAAGN